MNHLTNWVLCPLTLLIFLPAPIFAAPVDDDSILLEIGKLIGDALRGRAAEPQPVLRAMEAAEAPAEATADLQGAVGKKDQEEFAGRLQAYSAAMQEWVIKSCDVPAEQQAKLQPVFEGKLTEQVEKFSKKRSNDRQQQYLSATFPLLFTLSKNAAAPDFADDVVAELKKDVLTREQSEKLDVALKEREEFQHQAFVEYIVSLIDDELFLTGDQRKVLTTQMMQMARPVEHPLYSFKPQSYYLPYESLSVISSRATGDDVLEPSQKKRLKDLAGTDNNNQQIVFQAASGVEEWHKQMNQAGLKQREQFLRAAAVRVTWYEKELKLSPEQVEYLNNAGKGAAVRALGDWKESTQQTLDQMEQQMAQMGGNFGFGAQSIDTRAIEKNEIWADAVKSVTVGIARDRLEGRSDVDRTASARSVLALFDDELWLSPDQRTALLPMFEKTMPKDSTPTNYQEYIRDVVLMAHPLFKVKEKERNAIVTEAQGVVWKNLESYFQPQQGNNYVQIPLRNNGGSFGFNLAQ